MSPTDPAPPAFLVIADDLTGAADCAIALAGTSASPVVALHADRPASGPPPTAIDIDSRRMAASEAAAAVASAIGHHYSGPPQQLYKKLDSTLRGHVGVEIAAAYAAACDRPANTPTESASEGARPSRIAIVAPAYPSQGRTTSGGRQFLHGRPIEATPLWSMGGKAERADAVAMLRDAGMRPALLSLADIRQPLADLRDRLGQMAEAGANAAVCDAETDGDLFAIARAALGTASVALWAGSAGLARQLAAARGIGRWVAPKLAPPGGATLIVVGSAAETARVQASAVAALPGIVRLAIPVAALVAPRSEAWRAQFTRLRQALDRGHDIVVVFDDAETRVADGFALTAALGTLIGGAADRIGAVVATGGETARAIFTALGVGRLALSGQIEDGVVAAEAHGDWRGTVITKAGAFGDAMTLARAVTALRNNAATAPPATASMSPDPVRQPSTAATATSPAATRNPEFDT